MKNNTVSEQYVFLQFISGMSPKSARAIENLRKICDTHLKGNCRIEIVDINSDPTMAVTHQILATPTLIKLGPEPKRIVLGDLSETEKVMKILGIN